MSTPAPRSLTVREAISLYEALSALNGHVVSTTTESKTGEKTTTNKLVPYVFGVDGKGGGKVRWNVAKNLSILKGEYETFTKLRDALILEISKGEGTIDEKDKDAMKRLNAEVQELLDADTEVSGLLTIALDDLNLEGNPDLAPSVLAPLMSLITE